MTYVYAFLENRVLLSVVLSFFAAQIAKVVLTLIQQKKFDARRLIGLGGMPSSHSSSVCALSTSLLIAKGFYSAEFAISLVLAMIVMTDAMGVRQAAGKQAEMLNKIVADLIESGQWPTQEKLKELLGHTPMQVVVGALLGILISILVMQ